MSLPEPYASCPSRPGRYVFYITKKNHEEVHVLILAAVYSAKRTLELLVGKDEWVFEGVNCMRTSSGLHIINPQMGDVAPRCTNKDAQNYQLRKVWDHVYTMPELGWEILEPQRSEILRIRHGVVPKPFIKPVKRTQRTGTTRTALAGGIHIATIAAELNMEPKEARVILRKSNTPKPAEGWQWPSDKVDSIKAILTAGKK